MLPRTTHQPFLIVEARETGGRTLNSRNARSLRVSAVDLKSYSRKHNYTDCDVFSSDGGTRTASLRCMCCLVDALVDLRAKGILKNNPMKHMIARFVVFNKGSPL